MSRPPRTPTLEQINAAALEYGSFAGLSDKDNAIIHFARALGFVILYPEGEDQGPRTLDGAYHFLRYWRSVTSQWEHSKTQVSS